MKALFGSRRPRESAAEFWNRGFAAAGENLDPLPSNLAPSLPPFDQCFWDLLGDLRGRDVLEIGCGLGDNTLRLAAAGARVTAIDMSGVAVAQARRRLQAAGLNARLLAMDAFDLRDIDLQFDVIAGRFILHHLEPFGAMAEILAARLRPGGRMVFAENNARNKGLMLARQYLAGRFGIPKYGDAVEEPLSAAEIALLQSRFVEVTCHFPAMVFFSKLNTYVFRHAPVFRPATWLLDRLDETLWRLAPGLRQFSYNQIVTACRPAPD